MEYIKREEQKKIQLEILDYVIKTCNENNLTYFLGGGTLLGAIRHKGYIPWDDDIDIMLPRKDYEKLYEICNKDNDSTYKILSYKNEDDYYYPFNKIVDSRTKMIENKFREIKNLGIYIDIFPIDFVPDNKKKIKNIFKYYRIRERLVDIYKTANIDAVTKNNKKLILKKIILTLLKNKKVLKHFVKEMDEIGKKYIETNSVACISGRYYEKEVMPSSYIKDFVMVDFERKKVKAPVGYDEYLKKHYGNYMKLPPEKDRVADHDTTSYWRR